MAQRPPQAPVARTDERAAALRDPAHPLWSRPAPGAYRLRIETTKGSFVMEPDRALAPRGADRFYHLVETGFYDAATEFVEKVQKLNLQNGHG